MADSELAQEVKKLREAIESLQAMIESTPPAQSYSRDDSDAHGRGQQIAARIEELSELYRSEAISSDDYETTKDQLLAQLTTI